MKKTIFSYRTQSTCPICKRKGRLLYNDLTDKLYQVPGKWNFYICTNSKCGTVWLNPTIIESEIEYAYKNYHTHEVIEPRLSKFKSLNWLKKRYFDFIKYKYGFKTNQFKLIFILFNLFLYIHPLKKAFHKKYKFFKPENIDSKLLDIGCGNGSFLFRMKQFGWIAEGIDFDKRAIEIALKNNLKVFNSNLRDINYPDDTFDMIVLDNVFEHIYDLDALFTEVYRIMKPQGRVFINTPNIKSFTHTIFRENWRGLEPPRHIQILTLESLKTFLANHRFKIEKSFCSVQSNYVTIMSYLLRRNKKKISTIKKIILNIFVLFYAQLSFIFKNIGDIIVVIGKKDTK
ncbi:MAG: class I SAM-dependent methyltransferase [Calditrichaceae bacterium]|nr:class I SAM-dependent methyltransferase [Calditrichaceae bacterium]MBN2708048.1 class I SAM-dependent methyltransferase [Calditrichaceae bacterium]RQV97766.1 MAG: class I SAM-dependent methyltransferase [Calditrichota bacterium]